MLKSQSPAVRARSIVASAPTLQLRTDTHGAHSGFGIEGVDPMGRPYMVLPKTGDFARDLYIAGELPGEVLLVDIAAISVRQRERARLTLTGWLEYVGEGLLALDPQEICLEIDGERHYVDVDDYQLASPDPLAAHEAEILQHLCSGHAGELAALVASLPREVTESASRIAPLSLNRQALTLRVESGVSHVDVAMALPGGELATTADEVLVAMRALLVSCCEQTNAGSPREA